MVASWHISKITDETGLLSSNNPQPRDRCMPENLDFHVAIMAKHQIV